MSDYYSPKQEKYVEGGAETFTHRQYMEAEMPKKKTLETMFTNAEKLQLQEILMDDNGCITIDEARERAKKKWRKSG